MILNVIAGVAVAIGLFILIGFLFCGDAMEQERLVRDRLDEIRQGREREREVWDNMFLYSGEGDDYL